MHVLVACEFSAIVRDAFNAVGHDAWSCDVLDTEGRAGNHLKGDVRWALEGNLHKFPEPYDIRTGRTPLFKRWDLLIAHPPCTYLANSGVRWLYGGKGNVPDPVRWEAMEEARRFFMDLLQAPIERKCIENPIPHKHANLPPYTQIIQPWMFGHDETKATCLWLKNLKPLEPTKIVDGRNPRVHFASPGPDRWKERSRTKLGIAAAMAKQWG